MSKITFVRFRCFYKDVPPLVDILYNSGRMVSLGEYELPKTVRNFLQTAVCRYEYDIIFGHCFFYYQREATT